MPGRGGLENLRILKKSQLIVEMGPLEARVGYLAVGVGFDR